MNSVITVYMLFADKKVKDKGTYNTISSQGFLNGQT